MSNENFPILVVNARIATGHPRRPWADAALVIGGALAFVGGGAEAAKRAGPTARVVQAGGSVLTRDEVVPFAMAAGNDPDASPY